MLFENRAVVLISFESYGSLTKYNSYTQIQLNNVFGKHETGSLSSLVFFWGNIAGIQLSQS